MFIIISLYPFHRYIFSGTQDISGLCERFSKLEIAFCWEAISLTHLSPSVGLIPSIGVREIFNEYIYVDTVHEAIIDLTL